MNKSSKKNEIIMNEQQFLFAVKGTRLKEHSIEIARKVLVENKDRNTLADELDIKRQQISQIIKVVETNFKKKLKENNLDLLEVVVTPDQKEKAIKAEKTVIQEAMK